MKVVVSGGGTGGHIYPALALINEIKKHNSNVEFLYIGTENGLEKGIVERSEIDFKAIEITGFKRRLSFENVKTVTRFLKGVSVSKKYLKDFKPDVVIGTGGYVCGPVVYAASKLNIPTVIHEQNSLPGVTNKFLARYVNKIAICFEDAKKYFPEHKVVLTGNPRASEVLGQDPEKGRRSLGLKDNLKTVLIFGGSRGAKAINEAVLQMIPALAKKPYQVVYVTGEVHYDKVMEEMRSLKDSSNVIIKPFIHNMPEVLSAVDLIVSRAGATSLAEITALGLPSILIPSPYVTANHQEKNASSLSDHEAAIMLREQELNGNLLLSKIEGILLNDMKLTEMKRASKELGIPDAALRVYQVMKEISMK
ncbi:MULTISPECIES: undecaprenyldiphospho-muramoylpentapeptide beta-N-acetylglucosaminyltransferase [Metabacillus]|uniref:UDP-N-acetylglucosamine--N-acetylmuramyl-(pentapeptide) pyrophosphoryl-undecaprenol N-acetylglucosamine transferase n=2 Tax=Metabacillus TaxID=2675233 RepID=A0A179ST47_9BACI|nr:MULTISPECIES: undecaprenyldiphospho-muramoylpentapeptide beta-N-acetylglucosaminyltransferase [Metabacillus]OAS84564.1 UDP-N-acetylglucosamine--N-acetylmuramyl-(pentapeptide) pyrophosphoryl-undecaprenol N-acetylglucosamine transferase [Metabacillus litoralis]QNF29445.1 undecaprenyldiphospho-muramoylpentapeptide beta-N-acetylglucosaminyltransferase [Metabacillus sp. KUDC1714]